MKIKNNILAIINSSYSNPPVKFQGGDSDIANNTLDHNCVYNVNTSHRYWASARYTLSEFQSAFGQESNSKDSNPLFLNLGDQNYRLQSDSPCKDSGANLGTPYDYAFSSADISWPFNLLSQDQFGLGWEMGAFLFDSSPLPPTGLHIKP